MTRDQLEAAIGDRIFDYTDSPEEGSSEAVA